MALEHALPGRVFHVLPVLLSHDDAGWLTEGDIELTVSSKQLRDLVPKGQAILVWQPSPDAFVAGLSPVDCHDRAHRFGWTVAIPDGLSSVELRFEWSVPGRDCLIRDVSVNLSGVTHQTQTQLHLASRSLPAGKFSPHAHSASRKPPERWITKASFCDAPNALPELETRAMLRREQLQFRELL
jgi:hypothetical protein